MISERYIKAGIITGIVLASATFVISSIPFFLNYAPQISWGLVSSEEIQNKMKSTPEYKIFVERFPDYKTKFWKDQSSAGMTVYATDAQNEDRLMLNFYADSYRGAEVRQISAVCEAIHRESGVRYNADDLQVESFLKNTNCLD